MVSTFGSVTMKTRLQLAGCMQVCFHQAELEASLASLIEVLCPVKVEMKSGIAYYVPDLTLSRILDTRRK